MTIVSIHRLRKDREHRFFSSWPNYIDSLWYAVHRSDLNDGMGFRQLGHRCNGLSRAKQIGRELTLSMAIAMLKRYRLALVALISALYFAVFSPCCQSVILAKISL